MKRFLYLVFPSLLALTIGIASFLNFGCAESIEDIIEENSNQNPMVEVSMDVDALETLIETLSCQFNAQGQGNGFDISVRVLELDEANMSVGEVSTRELENWTVGPPFIVQSVPTHGRFIIQGELISSNCTCCCFGLANEEVQVCGNLDDCTSTQNGALCPAGQLRLTFTETFLPTVLDDGTPQFNNSVRINNFVLQPCICPGCELICI